MFSPNGNIIALLKRQDLEDSHRKNQVMVVNNIRDLRAHIALDDMPTPQSVKDWHVSPSLVAWNEIEGKLYDVAVEAGI